MSKKKYTLDNFKEGYYKFEEDFETLTKLVETNSLYAYHIGKCDPRCTERAIELSKKSKRLTRDTMDEIHEYQKQLFFNFVEYRCDFLRYVINLSSTNKTLMFRELNIKK